MQRVHGIAAAGPDGPAAVHFGIALWPYDLLLRFGYDLPENEHVWAGKWFDDRYEQAALDLRTTAAKLLLALHGMDEALRGLSAAAAESTPRRLTGLQEAVKQAPLAVDLVLHYLQRLLDDLAAVVPCVYGLDGQRLVPVRAGFATLAAAPELASLDAALPALLSGAPALAIPTQKAELYVIAASGGYAVALPRAAERALRDSAAVTLQAGAQTDAALRALCAWLDGVLAHLQQGVAARSEPGGDLLARWAEANWSVLLALPDCDPVLAAHLPAI